MRLKTIIRGSHASDPTLPSNIAIGIDLVMLPNNIINKWIDKNNIGNNKEGFIFFFIN